MSGVLMALRRLFRRKPRPQVVPMADLCLHSFSPAPGGFIAQFTSPAIPVIARMMTDQLREMKLVNRITMSLPGCGEFGDLEFVIQRIEGRTAEMDVQDGRRRIAELEAEVAALRGSGETAP